MNSTNAVSEYECELRRLLNDLAAMEDCDKLLMTESLRQAVTAIGGGFVGVAMATAERTAGSIAEDAMRKAAISARTTPTEDLPVAVEPSSPAVAAVSVARRFKPELGDEDRLESVGGRIRVVGVVTPSTLRELRAEMLSFGERGARYRRLLIDFSEATFDVDTAYWVDFSGAWLSVQSPHLGLGYVVSDPGAFDQFDRLSGAGVRRGQINLLWQRREDAVSWLGFR